MIKSRNLDPATGPRRRKRSQTPFFSGILTKKQKKIGAQKFNQIRKKAKLRVLKKKKRLQGLRKEGNFPTTRFIGGNQGPTTDPSS